MTSLNLYRKTLLDNYLLLDEVDQVLLDDIIDELSGCEGIIVVFGSGKSAIIAQKLVATLNSLSISAKYINLGESVHGDMGFVRAQDVAIFLSKSGRSDEMKLVSSVLNGKGVRQCLITLSNSKIVTGDFDKVLFVPFQSELDENDLIPTVSTSIQLFLCDVLALEVGKRRKVGQQEFALNHPGGNIGRFLLGKVEQFIDQGIQPKIDIEASLIDVLSVITGHSKGITAVMNKNELVGVITDGDIRRMLSETTEFKDLKARDIMTSNPKYIAHDTLAKNAINEMREYKITQLLVMKDNSYIGVLHIQDLMSKGF